jgi:protein-L-isoaspartate(D-aspartate) O-methyltransferase
MKPVAAVGREYAALRAAMVEWQLRQRGIRDPRVLDALREVPRHEFVPPLLIAQAYDDCPLPIGEGQTISQPYMVAAMTEAAELTGSETVLEVGTGSGYQAAVLARLVPPPAGRVYTIEQYASLSAQAQERLRHLGITNVTCIVGDGSLGYPEAAPYEAIVVTAGAPEVPPALLEQLADGGRLVIPVGRCDTQELLLVRKHGAEVTRETVNYCRFVPLTGRFGWGGR